MDEYAESTGRLLADRYRLPRSRAGVFGSAGTAGKTGALRGRRAAGTGEAEEAGLHGEFTAVVAFDTASDQEVLVRQIPLPEVVDAEVVDGDAGGGRPYGVAGPAGGFAGAGRATRRPADPTVRRAVEAAWAAGRIPDHPRLDQVYDVFVEGDGLWVVSELVPARPLSSLLAERPLEAHRAAEIAADLLAALRAVHAYGWTHRNVTAQTVLICDDGRAVLTGLAAGAAEEALCGYDPTPAVGAVPAAAAVPTAASGPSAGVGGGEEGEGAEESGGGGEFGGGRDGFGVGRSGEDELGGYGAGESGMPGGGGAGFGPGGSESGRAGFEQADGDGGSGRAPGRVGTGQGGTRGGEGREGFARDVTGGRGTGDEDAAWGRRSEGGGSSAAPDAPATWTGSPLPEGFAAWESDEPEYDPDPDDEYESEAGEECLEGRWEDRRGPGIFGFEGLPREDGPHPGYGPAAEQGTPTGEFGSGAPVVRPGYETHGYESRGYGSPGHETYGGTGEADADARLRAARRGAIAAYRAGTRRAAEVRSSTGRTPEGQGEWWSKPAGQPERPATEASPVPDEDVAWLPPGGDEVSPTSVPGARQATSRSVWTSWRTGTGTGLEHASSAEREAAGEDAGAGGYEGPGGHEELAGTSAGTGTGPEAPARTDARADQDKSRAGHPGTDPGADPDTGPDIGPDTGPGTDPAMDAGDRCGYPDPVTDPVPDLNLDAAMHPAMDAERHPYGEGAQAWGAGGETYRGPGTALAAERARQARMTVVGPVTERWSPEQAGPVHRNWRLAPPVGPAADLWALGALLFRAVQGHAPYPEESAAELVQLVCAEPPAFAEECGALRPVVESLMRQDPTERPDFEELRGWLRSLVRSAPEPEAGHRTVVAPPSLEPGRPSDPRRLPILRRRGELVRRRRGRGRGARSVRTEERPRPTERRRHKRGRPRSIAPVAPPGGTGLPQESPAPSPVRDGSEAPHEAYVTRQVGQTQPLREPRTKRQKAQKPPRTPKPPRTQKQPRAQKPPRPPKPPKAAKGTGSSRSPRSLGWWIVGLVLFGLTAVVLYAMWFMPRGGTESGGQGDQQRGSVQVPDNGPSSDGSRGPEEDKGKDGGGQNQGDGKGAGQPQRTAPAEAKTPKGYKLSKDPAGFRIAVPDAWDRRSTPGNGQVRYNGGQVEMVIVNGRDATRKYGEDPSAYQSDDEPELAAYRASDWATTSGLRRIDVGETSMAEGTFGWQDSGRQVYARNRAVILDGRYHVLLVMGSEGKKKEIDRVFEDVADTYRVTR